MNQHLTRFKKGAHIAVLC